MARSRFFIFAALSAIGPVFFGACLRGNQVPWDGGVASYAQDAGVDGGVDAGVAFDVRNYNLCPADAGPPTVENGGLIWSNEILPSVNPPQDAGWVALSTDPECAALTPGRVPPRLSWNVTDGGAACDPAWADGQGNLGVDWLNATGLTVSFFSADGSRAEAVHDGNVKAAIPEAVRSFSIRPNGFVLVSRIFPPDLDPWCYFVRLLGQEGNPVGSPIQGGVRYDEDLDMLFTNPLGGFVEVRETTNGQMPPDTVATLDTRFVDDALQPVGDWSTVITMPAGNLSWALGVDQQGRALVLAFMYPPSLGPPPPPSEWTFAARWMGPSGPLGDEFQPATPIFTPNSPNGYPLFAGWGTFLSLPEGGFAMYQGHANPSYGTSSPAGWYAYYPSGQSGSEPAPSWLSLYDGTLRMLPNGAGYAALQYNDPNSCARTVLLVAPSGRACFKLDLADTAGCAALQDAIWPDGTLIIQGDSQSVCKLQWWPGLARLAR